MTPERERRFYWILVIAILAVALVIVARTTWDALASPVVVALDAPLTPAGHDDTSRLHERTAGEGRIEDELERARAYNRRLEKILHREVSRAERMERSLTELAVQSVAPWAPHPLGNHWLETAFQCIHHHEGAWTDPNLPYFGGLQMDLDFQRAYGRDYLKGFGTADRWPVSVQLAVAIRGYISRGFQPWPTTRRMCGL